MGQKDPHGMGGGGVTVTRTSSGSGTGTSTHGVCQAPGVQAPPENIENRTEVNAAAWSWGAGGGEVQGKSLGAEPAKAAEDPPGAGGWEGTGAEARTQWGGDAGGRPAVPGAA